MNEIFLKLKENGIEVYYVGQKKGICTSNYVVLKDGGTQPYLNSNRIGKQMVDVLFFIPKNNFSKVESYKREVKSILKTIGLLRYTGVETPVITDNQVEGLTWSVLYEIQKKLEG